jgi:hypothetical protein
MARPTTRGSYVRRRPYSLAESTATATGLCAVHPRGSHIEERAGDKQLTDSYEERRIVVPMARIVNAERMLRGQALSSIGALACWAGPGLDHEITPGRRSYANTGRPVVRS